MRTRPLVALLGIIVGATIAFLCWKWWRSLVDQPVMEPVGSGPRPDAADRTAAPPPIPVSPAPPAPPPMPFGTVFDPLAAVEDTPALYREAERIEEDEVASTLSEIGGSPEAATELAETLVSPPVADSIGRPTLQERFGPDAVAPVEHGVCPEDHPVKGNANSMIYHLPGQSSYAATNPEVCFTDAAAAESAGFRPRKR
jgi:hypothetical protein